MKKEIRCLECNEKIGEIEKDIITQEDEDKYREMVTCSNGHQQTATLAQIEE